MWGLGPFFDQVAPDGDKWLSLLFGSGGLLAGLVIAVRAYDSGRVVTRAQHDAELAHLKEAHQSHVSDLRARATEDREQRDRWEKIALDAIRANNRLDRARDRAPLPLDDEGLGRLG